MKDSEVIVETVKNVSKMIDTGNQNAILALAIRGASEAKLAAPKDTVLLANSIQYITGTGHKGGLNDQSGDKAEGLLSVSLRKYEAAIGATALYAPYQEFGTRYQHPQLFLRPSLQSIAGKTNEVVQDWMEKELKAWEFKYGKERRTYK